MSQSPNKKVSSLRDSQNEKTEVLLLRNKITDLIRSDSKKLSKAVILLTQWMAESLPKKSVKKSA